MNAARCVHKERMVTEEDCEIGTCSECGQVTRYTSDGEKPVIIKLGRLGPDDLVAPHAGFKLELEEKDQKDLAGVDYQEQIDQPEKRNTKPVPKAMERRNYYRTHKTEMIADLLAGMNNHEFLAKYPVSAQIVSHLKSDPQYAGQIKKEHVFRADKPIDKPVQIKSSSPAAAQDHDHRLPTFPAFSDSWPEKVQLKWLDTYAVLRR